MTLQPEFATAGVYRAFRLCPTTPLQLPKTPLLRSVFGLVPGSRLLAEAASDEARKCSGVLGPRRDQRSPGWACSAPLSA